ncbi:hypothetical protein PV04_04073 [Phialophora macrospora]|uniref:Uncharacterized protein n=1 Tax=Phialophora macrospora TaxID=1851006 RepID=A0A0D2CSG2_9EURO|nr:hypothetical protein PV04_04073 [Phialophora macrospora]
MTGRALVRSSNDDVRSAVYAVLNFILCGRVSRGIVQHDQEEAGLRWNDKRDLMSRTRVGDSRKRKKRMARKSTLTCTFACQSRNTEVGHRQGSRCGNCVHVRSKVVFVHS